jgi:hypothetical protein
MTKYQLLTKAEEEQVIIQIIEKLLDPYLPFSGEHRKEQWERGWEENLNTNSYKPKYFDKYPIQRFNGQLVRAVSPNYEQEMLYSIVDELAEKYLKGAEHIYEFGCGTGHNMLRVRQINKDAILYGCDWTESSNKLVEKLGFKAINFDYFNPPQDRLEPNAAVYTVVSLEQVGKKYKKFVKYLLKSKPKIVVHIEPIPELLDENNLLDYLSIKYMEKRRYLSGYLKHLRSLEQRGYLKILEARRSGIGSMFIDGYSIIVWTPL